ncbi:DUF6249 domain-containing protein [Pedobacter frigoris]|uniref:DUF6249 domain-containing protein n=1 Tax=Pedobacter frigoris TaxID=2571272 RepID=UPI00292F0C1E|nr:DUF6249 domain-containing protein [Pedobacter frigoris]
MESFAATTIIWLIVWFSFCTCLFLAWFFSHRAKHKERLMMIEKGLNPIDEENKYKRPQSFGLMLGLIIFGLGIGLVIIAVLVNLDALGKSDATPVAILALCGGSALIIGGYIENRKKN